MLQARLARVVLAAAALSLVGACGPGGGGGHDARTDGKNEAGADARRDAGDGAAKDALPDLAAEVATENDAETADAPVEAATDAPTESAADAPTEAATDAPTESVTDAPTEAATDARPEAGTEAGNDAPPDLAMDLATEKTPDAPPDVTPDLPVEKTPDAPADLATDAPAESSASPDATDAAPAEAGPFDPSLYNLVFVSSVRDLPTDLGSAKAYDAVCNQLATTAAINNATNDAYVAMISDSHSTMQQRLGNARGFVRPDGAPVADDIQSFFAGGRMFYPLTLNEHGAPSENIVVLTGMQSDGSLYPTKTCNDWTSRSSSFNGMTGGANRMIWELFYFSDPDCDGLYGGLVCFGKTKSVPLNIVPTPGKKIFLTNAPVKIGDDAQAMCAAAKPPGTGAVSVLRSTTTVPASTMIVPTATYVRVDGVVIGKGSDLLANTLESGIIQQGDGKYIHTWVWTGSDDPSQTGTDASTCSNWTSKVGTLMSGATDRLNWWHNQVFGPCDNATTWSYCIER